jgi:hypothetical protein
LMASIATRGIEEPLEGVDASEQRFRERMKEFHDRSGRA